MRSIARSGPAVLERTADSPAGRAATAVVRLLGLFLLDHGLALLLGAGNQSDQALHVRMRFLVSLARGGERVLSCCDLAILLGQLVVLLLQRLLLDNSDLSKTRAARGRCAVDSHRAASPDSRDSWTCSAFSICACMAFKPLVIGLLLLRQTAHVLGAEHAELLLDGVQLLSWRGPTDRAGTAWWKRFAGRLRERFPPEIAPPDRCTTFCAMKRLL